MKLISKFLPLILTCVMFESSYAGVKITPKSAGSSVDESFVYKNKRVQKSMYGTNQDTIASLPTKKKVGAKMAKASSAILDYEVFAVGKVNREPITNIDVMNRIKLLFFFSGKEYDKSIAKMMVPTVIESLADDTLRDQCAKIFNVEPSEGEIENEISRIAQENGLTEQELSDKVEAAGISLKILKKHIRSRLIFQVIRDSFAEDEKISQSEIDMIKAEQVSLRNSKRYFISEIFRYDANTAEQILQLAHKGFDFQILAESFSQAIKAEKRGTPRWVKADNLEPEVYNSVKSLELGEMSGVIKTKSGYKLVALLDIADAGKAPRSNSIYKILEVHFVYQGGLFMRKDIKRSEEIVEKFTKVKTPEEFENLCAEYDLQMIDRDVQNPDAYHRELISRSKQSGSPAILQSPEDNNAVNIVLCKGEIAPVSQIPSEKDIKGLIFAEKIEETFSRNFKKLKAAAQIEKYADRIGKVIQ